MHTHTSPGRAPTARTAVAALVAAAACWGTGTVVSKQVVDDVAPLTLLPMQLAASCVLLLVITLARREPFAWTPPVRRLAALGVLNPGIAYALGLIGLTTITASMSVLLWALEPVAIMLLAALVLREHIPLRARGRGRRGHRRGAAGRLPARRHRRRGRHHAHPGLDRVLCPVLGADPAAAARRLRADRGARPAGRRAGLRRRPGDGRRHGRRHRLGPRPATAPGTGWPPRRPASCTTGSGSGSS